MKRRHSVWQRIQAVFCFIVQLCVVIPMALAAITPTLTVQLLELLGAELVAEFTTVIAALTNMQRIALGAMALITLLCSLRLMVLVCKRPKQKRDKAGVAMQDTMDGPIHISVPAVETLVSEGIRDVQGLSDVRMKVTDNQDSVSIELTMAARSDINIPETMMRLQARIKDYVQESAGVDVQEVRLNVDRVLMADGIQALPAGSVDMKAEGGSYVYAQEEQGRKRRFGRKGKQEEPAPVAAPVVDEPVEVKPEETAAEPTVEEVPAAEPVAEEPVVDEAPVAEETPVVEPAAVENTEPEAEVVEAEVVAEEETVENAPAADETAEEEIVAVEAEAVCEADEACECADEQPAAIVADETEEIDIGDTSEDMLPGDEDDEDKAADSSKGSDPILL